MAFLPLVFQGLNGNLTLKAKMELNEDEGKKSTGLMKLKELIRDEKVACCTDNDFLIMFLRCKKYDPKRSFEQVKSYARKRRENMKYDVSDDFDLIQKVLDSKVCGILPRRDREGRAILFFRACQFAPSAYSADDVMRTTLVLCHFALSFPATQVCGLCFIADATIDSVEVLRLLLKYLRLCVPDLHIFPARFKRVDCINTNILFRTCFHLIRPLVPSKLLKRATLHGYSTEALLKVYPPDILPKEFGGTLGSIDDLQYIWIHELKKFLPNLVANNVFYKVEPSNES